MNKTLMLIISDFLLLSMLALARFDTPQGAPEPRLEGKASVERSAENELVKALEESLAAELKSREDVSEDLTQTRETLEAKERRLAEREEALRTTRERLEKEERTAGELRESKTRLAEERERLAREKETLEARRKDLEAKVEATRSELEAANKERVDLAKDMGDLKETASVTGERLNRTREELEAREVALAEREAALREAREKAEKLAEEREALNRRLEVARAERKLLEQNLTEEQKEKLALRREKEEAFARAERLTENVSELGQGVSRLDKGMRTLSESSEKMREEMDEARPRTMSEIFTRFQNNRAVIRFTTTESTLFGGSTEKTYESRSILAEGKDGVYLVTHSANTPFAFGRNHGKLSDVRLTLDLGGREVAANRIGFLSADPRLVFIPLPGSAVRNSGLETFQLARQPERWEEAVLVKNDESNFGRTGFRRLTTSDRFLRMDRPALGELFSEFASSRGDLAFSKNSRFIGVLTNPKHAVVIDQFLASAVLELGEAFAPEKADATLDRLEDRLRKLPSEVR